MIIDSNEHSNNSIVGHAHITEMDTICCRNKSVHKCTTFVAPLSVKLIII